MELGAAAAWRSTAGLRLAVIVFMVVSGCTPEGDEARPQDDASTAVEVPSGILKHQGRSEWFLDQRVYPGKRLPEGALPRAHARALDLPAVWELHDMIRADRHPTRREMFLVFANALGAWRPLGPAPVESRYGSTGPTYPHAGRIGAIATHPTDPDTVYVGSPGGGVWKTTTGGTEWTPLFDSMPTLVVNALAIDPNRPNVIYAGTGSDLAGSSYTAAGLFVSRDDGDRWRKTDGGAMEGCVINRISIHPENSSLILVAAGTGGTIDREYLPECSMGVFRSVDGGGSWQRVLADKNVLDVTFGDTEWSSMYAAVHGEGIHRSQDGGETWTHVTQGIPSSDVSVVKLAVAPSRPERLYVAAGLPPNHPVYLKGVWVSDDGGDSWTERAARPDMYYAFLSMAVDPADPDRLYVGSVPLHASQDAAASFDIVQGAIHHDVPALAFDAAGRLVVGTDGGVYRRRPGTPPGYDNINGNLAVTQFWPGISGSLAAGPANVTVVGGAQDIGTLFGDAAAAWTCLEGGDGGATAVDPDDRRRVYYCSYNVHGPGPLCRKVLMNNGRRDQLEDLGPAELREERSEHFPPLVLDAARPDRLYIGTTRVWRTTSAREPWIPDGSWQPLSDPFPANPNPVTVRTIAASYSDGDVIYAGFCGQLIVTTDGGATWTDTAGNGLGDRCVTDIAVHPDRAGEAYATTSGVRAGHVFRTVDFGATWTDVSGSLPDAPANAVAIDPESSRPLLFVGTDVGVFVSPDHGTRWGRTGKGLPNSIVTDLLYDPETDHLVAATHGRGMWAAPLRRFERLVRPDLRLQTVTSFQQFAKAFSENRAATPP